MDTVAESPDTRTRVKDWPKRLREAFESVELARDAEFDCEHALLDELVHSNMSAERRDWLLQAHDHVRHASKSHRKALQALERAARA